MQKCEAITQFILHHIAFILHLFMKVGPANQMVAGHFCRISRVSDGRVERLANVTNHARPIRISRSYCSQWRT